MRDFDSLEEIEQLRREIRRLEVENEQARQSRNPSDPMHHYQNWLDAKNEKKAAKDKSFRDYLKTQEQNRIRAQERAEAENLRNLNLADMVGW